SSDLHAKSDAEVAGVRPVMGLENVTLLTETKVERLLTSLSGCEITGVEAVVDGDRVTFTADVVVVACGSINSATLLLKSATDQRPNGLANSSGMVGRNLMKHIL